MISKIPVSEPIRKAVPRRTQHGSRIRLGYARSSAIAGFDEVFNRDADRRVYRGHVVVKVRVEFP